MDKQGTSSTRTKTTQRGGFTKQSIPVPGTLLSLPPELHHMIATHLPYPDLLSLKLSCPYFQALFAEQPTVQQRIGWVVSRGKQRMPIPHASKTNFRLDAAFVQNPEVASILRRRRLHIECVECKFARIVLPLRYLPIEPEKSSLFCFVNEGYECPKLRALRDERLLLDQRLAYRLQRLATWPPKMADAFLRYLCDHPGWPARGVRNVARRCAQPSTWRYGMYLGVTVICLALLLALAIVCQHTWYACIPKVSGVWLATSLAFSRWLEALWEDWVQELHITS